MIRYFVEILLGILIPILILGSSIVLLYPNSYFFILLPLLLLLGITIWLNKKYTKKIAKIILWIMSSLAMLMFLILFLDGLKPKTEFVYMERPKRPLINEIMEADSLTLYEKLISINLTQSNNSRVVAFKITTDKNIKTNNSNSINSLYLNNNIIKIDKQRQNFSKANDYNSINIQFLSEFEDYISIEYPNGDNFNIAPYQKEKGDSLTFIGFLSKEDFFVYARSMNELVVRYYTVNLKTGETISDVPMFPNQTKQYYAFVHFQDVIGTLYLRIKLWEKIDNDLMIIYDEEIPLNAHRDDDFRFKLSDMNWQNTNTFTFNIHEEKETVETVNVRIEIISL